MSTPSRGVNRAGLGSQVSGPWERFARAEEAPPAKPWERFKAQPEDFSNVQGAADTVPGQAPPGLFDDVLQPRKAGLFDDVLAQPANEAPDYSAAFREPASLGDIALRALVGRAPELLANLVELPANIGDALGDYIGLGDSAPATGGFRAVAEGIRSIGYEREMEAAGFGAPNVSGADVVEALTPSADLTLGDRMATLGQFVPETLIASVPDMVATLNPATLAGYIGARTNEIAEDRAANDNRQDVRLGDLGAGAIAAPVEALLERFTTMRLLPQGTTMATPGILPALGRIARELGIQGSLGGIEELAPYLASGVGTEAGVTGQGALETFAGGALAEGTLGGAVQGGKEAIGALGRRGVVPPDVVADVGLADAVPAEVAQVAEPSALKLGDLVVAQAGSRTAEQAAPPLPDRAVARPQPADGRSFAMPPAADVAQPEGDGDRNALALGTLAELLVEGAAPEISADTVQGSRSDAAARPAEVREADALHAVDAQAPQDAVLESRAVSLPPPGGEAPSHDQRALAPEISRESGLEDSRKLGLGPAVMAAVGDAQVRPIFLRGLAGLSGVARPEYVARVQEAQGSMEGQKTAGLFLPAAEALDGKPAYVVFTDVANTPALAAFTAAHEAAGHFGLRALLGQQLEPALEIALQNTSVKAVADAIARTRRLPPERRLHATEEALAELAAAVRTNDWGRIHARHGVSVSPQMRSRVRSAVDNFLRRLKALFQRILGSNLPEGFSDAQVRALVEQAWTAARDPGREAQLPTHAPAVLLASTQGALDAQSNAPGSHATPLGEPAEGVDIRYFDVSAPQREAWVDRKAGEVAKQFTELRATLSGRVPHPQAVTQRLADTMAAAFSSIVSRARRIEARNPQSTALRKLFNLVMAAPGDSRLVGETVNDAIHARAKTFTNRARNILANNGLDRMSPDENARLRSAMLEKDSKAPPKIAAAARQLRKLMDVQRQDMIAAGIDVGEVQDVGYLTRIYDTAKILNEESRFLGAAAELYSRHEFPLEVGESPQETFYGDGTLARFIGYARQAAVSDAVVGNALEALKSVGRRYRNTSNTNDEAAEALRLIGIMAPRVATWFGDMRASAWMHHIKTPDVRHVLAHASPSGAPVTRGRELSGAADVVLARYLKTDILDILDAYARTASVKIEHAVRFGPDGGRIQALIDQASAQGVPPGDLEQAVTLVDSVLGLNRRVPESHLRATADFLHAWTYLALLGRATFSSLGESVTYAIRTGNLVHTVAPLIQLQRAVTRSRKGKALNELAQAIAVNGHRAVEDVLMNRLGGDYSMSPHWSALMHRFFYATLLTPLTRAQRAYGVGAATGFLRHLSKQLKAGQDLVEVRALLNEVGIADHEAFADWMLAQAAVPDPRGMYDEDGRPTPRGQEYMVAVRRIVDQSIQNPGAEHRPAWTNNPVGRLVTGIMSFSYAAYENIIRREAAVMARQLAEQGRGRALQRNANVLVGASALVLAQTLTSTLRELLFNLDRFVDKDDDEIAREMVSLGLSRTFGLGSADPLIQYLMGLKYQRGLAETAVGAGPSLLFQAIDRGGNLGTDRNSPNTDTAEYRFAQSAYSVAIAPALNVVLSRTPLVGGPGIMALGGTTGRDWFASQFARKPDRRSEVDERYQEATAELDAMLETVDDRISMLPSAQWAQELEVLKAEYPALLAGTTLDVYVRGGKYGGPGEPKRTRDGKPLLKLEAGNEAGSVLGELEGYPYWYTNKGRREQGTTEGIQDRIAGLDKAIRNLEQDREVTLADLMAFARKAPSVQAVMDRYWTADDATLAQPAGSRLTNKVLDELRTLRTAEKRRALEVIDRGKRGDRIIRGASTGGSP